MCKFWSTVTFFLTCELKTSQCCVFVHGLLL